MAHLIDTDVAIFLRDRQHVILTAISALDEPPLLSVISQVELEGGVYAQPEAAERRRRAVETLLATLTVLPFDVDAADSYGRIIAAVGFSRRKVADRMVAATAIAHGLTLITMNGSDFSDIPGLSRTIWPSPAA